MPRTWPDPLAWNAPSWYRAQPVPACPACGGAGEPYVSRCGDAFPEAVPVLADYRRCRACASLWMDPCPVEDAIPHLYPSYYTHEAPRALWEPTPGLRWAQLRADVLRSLVAQCFGYSGAAAQGGTAARVLARMLAWVPAARARAGRQVRFIRGRPGGRLIDVGCGNGQFLRLMRDLGWTVLGIEPDERAAAAASSAGIPVENGRVEDVLRRVGPADAITCVHVLEHLREPAPVLRALIRSLVPGGTLTVISPNPRGMLARAFARHWFSLDPPRHLVLPSPEGYRRMLSAVDLPIRTQVSTLAFGAAGIARESLSIRRGGALDPAAGWALPKLIAHLALPGAMALDGEAGEEVACVVQRHV